MTKPKDKARIISESSAILYREGDKFATDEEKVGAIMRYISATYLLSFRTAKEYAEIALMRHRMSLPDLKRSTQEILARDQAKSRLQQRLEQEEKELRDGWGKVREFVED